MAGNKNVSLQADITNDDGSKFARFTAEYSDMPIDGVVAIEEAVVTGFINPMLDVAKQLAAAKKDAQAV